jgi:hypothetical protein
MRLLTHKRLRWLWLALFWILFTVILLEGGLRLIGGSLPGQIGVTARTITTGQPYAESWTPAWRENRDHYYALRPNIQNELQYGTPTVSFRLTTRKLFDDGLPADTGIGFRNRAVDYKVNAVVVGDSFGFCFTEESECWVNLLEAQTGLGIVNLSQPVTGSISHAKMLRDFGAVYEPELVIWQFFGNDFNDDYGLLQWRGDIAPIEDTSPTATPTLSHSTDIGDWLRRNSVTVAVLEVALTGRWNVVQPGQEAFTPNYSVSYADGQVMQFGKLYERQALDMSRPANQFGLEQSREAFAESKALVESWDGQMVVVIIPTREEVYDHLTEALMGKSELDKQRSARLAMLDLCAELLLTCIDPLAAFQTRARQNDVLYYNDDMHLNPAGNAALAEIIGAWWAER